MTGWQIALGITIMWFAVSVPVTVVVGKALRITAPPANDLLESSPVILNCEASTAT